MNPSRAKNELSRSETLTICPENVMFNNTEEDNFPLRQSTISSNIQVTMVIYI
jgi:hypothetical protein